MNLFYFFHLFSTRASVLGHKMSFRELLFWLSACHNDISDKTMHPSPITQSLFHSRLKSLLFCKSSLPQPFLFFFKIHYMDFPDCLLLLLSISVSLFFSFFCFYTFLVVGSVR